MSSTFKSAFGFFVQTLLRAAAWFGAFLLFVMFLGAIGGTTERVETRLQSLPRHDFSYGRPEDPKIWEIAIRGTIENKSTLLEDLREQAAFFARGRDPKNKLAAIILLIDSGGGSASMGFALHELVASLKKELDVPIFTYVEGICASAAYLIASPSTKIYANPSSLLGSIGVLLQAYNYSKLMEKVGVESRLIVRGEGKGDGSATMPWNERSFDQLFPFMDLQYTLFRERVAKYRLSLTAERLEEELGARVYGTNDALSSGYIDQIIDSKELFLEQVTKELELKNYTLVRFQNKKKFASQLLDLSGPAVDFFERVFMAKDPLGYEIYLM